MKRFWTNVSVDADRGIRLDSRALRTPARTPLLLPTDALAGAVAEEWRSVGETIDPRAMPLTGLANAAIDRIAPDPAGFAAGLARYAQTDLLCYRAPSPDLLVARQAAAWDPLLAWASARYDVHLVLATGVMPVAQPTETVARLTRAITAYDAFTLAALSPVVTIGGSLVAALALAQGAIDLDTLWQAVDLDEAWTAEQWGEDAQALAERAARRDTIATAARFLALLADDAPAPVPR